jgi:ribose-phosphate pyrophosphokinase
MKSTNQRFYLCDRHTARGRLLIAGCNSGIGQAQSVFDYYQRCVQAKKGNKTIQCLLPIDRRFSDGEAGVSLDENVRGADVFFFQSLCDPTSGASIDDNYMSFFIAVRALRDHGAAHITGVLPYLGYARQDKPTDYMREPITARLMADFALTAGLNQLLTWAPHSQQQGLFGSVKVDALDAQSLLSREFIRFSGRKDVIVVAPDAGAIKFATKIADNLNLSYALAEKHRPRPGEAKIANIVGDFSDKTTVLIFDDMIASAGTMVALIEKIIKDYPQIKAVYIGASHNLCLDPAYTALLYLHEQACLQEVVITNSIPQTERFMSLPFLKVLTLSEILAHAINRIHYNKSVSECFRP